MEGNGEVSWVWEEGVALLREELVWEEGALWGGDLGAVKVRCSRGCGWWGE